jgi:uncharacterized protein YndB with AHSA1/START domain
VSNPNDLEIVVLFDAPRELVFRNWTEAARMQTWFAPDGSVVTACEVSAHPGGRWRVKFRAADGTECLEYGEFREVVEPERLVFTLTHIEGRSVRLETLVTVTFAPVGSSTRMTFQQTGFDTPIRRDEHREGWSECFRKLDAHLGTP